MYFFLLFDLGEYEVSFGKGGLWKNFRLVRSYGNGLRKFWRSDCLLVVIIINFSRYF